MNAHGRAHGYSLVEMVVVAAVIMVMAAVAVPYVRAYAVESHLFGAARVFKGKFRLARSIAARAGVYTAIRFEKQDDRWYYSLYQDGDSDGVTAADIKAGRDPRIAGPFPLDGGAPGVRVGINAGVPAPPPDSGTLDPRSDPIKFGPGKMVSFSPMGTATPGTFYLAGQVRQAAVRVTGGSARVRMMVCRGKKWVEEP
ncbi:MAG TPA: GspH/FimT family protein [Vicinamibacteria bacterium]|nr:GspH/FimT family protein [Vicinamibacteria bacterium]